MMQRKGALEGIKVADFGWITTEPLTTKYLADHGATVVRVESHTRVDIIRISAPYKDEIADINHAVWFGHDNSSKLGISLDLTKAKGKEVALKLIKWGDIVGEGYTPGVMKRWGLGYDEVKKVKPDIIYYSTCMYGQAGPYSRHPSYGYQGAAAAGSTELTGWPERGPSTPYGAYTDFTTPRYGVAAILAALDYRRRTGKGQYIDLAQLEEAVDLLAPVVLDYTVNGRVAKRNGNKSPWAAPHGVFRCQGDDRWCTLAVFNDEEWSAFCDTIGNPDWTREARFATVAGRKKNESELNRLVEDWTGQHPPEEVMKLMQAAGVPSGVVQNMRDMAEDPQLKYRGHYRVLEHSVMGYHRYDAVGFRLSKTPDSQFAAPALGQDNEYVYKELLGLSDDEVADLLVEGVITTEADLPQLASWM
jgi:benzylsuccinate CoA-transferase BbsF subunit